MTFTAGIFFCRGILHTISRRTSRSSTPQVDSVPGYGRRASIPPIGFEFDPEAILRRSRQERRRYLTPTDIIEGIRLVSSGNDRTVAIERQNVFVDEDITIGTRILASICEEIRLAFRPLPIYLPPRHFGSPKVKSVGDTTNILTTTSASTLLINLPLIPLQLEQKELKMNPALTTQSTTATSNKTDANINATVETADETSENSKISAGNISSANASSAMVSTTGAQSDDSETVSDDDGEASDIDENEEPRDDSFGFATNQPSKMYIRHPLSSEPWTTEYDQQVRDQLITFLANDLSSFYLTLVVLCEKFPDDDTPTTEVSVVVIVFDPEMDTNISTNIPTIPDTFVVVICHGQSSFLADIKYPVNRKYQKNPMIGVSISAKENGTVGLYMTTRHEKFYGISCAHVLGNTTSHRRVQQPCPKDFVRHLKAVEHEITDLERLLTLTTHDITKYTFNEEMNELKDEQNVLQALNNPLESELKKNLSFGKVRKAEFEAVEYQGRTCIADWGVFNVDEQRSLSLTRTLTSGPLKGILADTSWNTAWDFGPLQFDDLVRKTGRTTGTTYGFIGGMYSSFKPGGRFNEHVCDEYWALEDNSVMDNAFAEKGDSGSAVINSQGYVVGFVFAHVDIDALKIIVDPKRKVPDIPKIKERRQADGSVDIEGLVAEAFVGEKFVLIESAEMVMERWQETGVELVLNC